MMWDNSPWAIENGQTSADVGRLLARLATNGVYGVHGIGDLKVRAKATPGGEVLVGPGAVTVPCRALGKMLQSYVGLNPTDDPLTIPSTGSSGGRSDLIVARVENPINGEPWNELENPLTQQYIFSRRYPGVAPTTTSVDQIDPSASAFTLARIDIPANTEAITDAMIVDLRGKPDSGEPPLPSTPMASANQDFYVSQNYGRTALDDVLAYNQSAFKVWPNDASWLVSIPANATEAVIDVHVECQQRVTPGQSASLANCWGEARIRMVVDAYDYSQLVEFDKDYFGNNGGPTTVSVPVGGTLAIPAALRGRRALFQLQARQYTDANTRGRLVVGRGSYVRCHIHFNVRPS